MKKIIEVVGHWKDDGTTLIEMPNQTEHYRLPNAVVSHIQALESDREKDIKIIKTLAQTVADMAAMMTPFSGLTMMGLMMQADHAGKHIGEEIKPSEQAFNGTVNIVNTIRKPLDSEIKKLSEGLRKVGMELHHHYEAQNLKTPAKEIWKLMSDLQVLTDADRCRPVDTDELK